MKILDVTTDVDVYNLFDSTEVILNEYIIDDGLVSAIVDGKSIAVFDQRHALSLSDRLIKVEGLEKWSRDTAHLCSDVASAAGHTGPVTIHLFQTPLGARSFPMHRDPDDVVLLLLSGRKWFNVDGEVFEMIPGTYYYIAANVPHCAVESDNSVMLSIGLEKYLSEKLDWV